ncbi:MAG: hypothetical protein AAGA92_10795 [Planctomycetota bacterium]
MTTFLITLTAFGVALAGMAIGVIVSDRRIRGSCGGSYGQTNEEGETVCQLCSTPSPDCQGEQAEA